MDSIDIYLNNNLIAFTDNNEIIKRLKEDDEFLIDYVVRAIRGGLVEFIDPNFDLENLEILRVNADSPQLENVDDSNPIISLVNVWTSKAKPTNKDLEATELLLQLRGKEKFIKKFNDKKTHKLNLWKEIAALMKEKGFDVDAEKCRQKFSNLTKGYLNFVRHVHTTGEEKRNQPDFYNELHKILGEKDKVTLEHTSDSLKLQSRAQTVATTVDPAVPGTSSDVRSSQFPEVEEESSAEITVNVPGPTTRKNKPEKVTKENILNVINEQFRQQTQQQEDHFGKLYKILEKQTEQRGQLIDLLRELVTPKQKSKKRRRSGSESE